MSEATPPGITDRPEDNPVIQIIADHRESGCGVIEALMAMPEVEVKVQTLPLGDYLADRSLLFERKTLIDLAASIVSGRFFSQACRMAERRKRPVWILEGTAKDLASSGMSRESIQGAIITLTVILGIPVLRSLDPAETARLILYTGRQVRRAIPSNPVYRQGYRPKGKRKRQIFILQGLPGIGPKRATDLLVKFGSVEAVMRASAEELEFVRGIGPTRAARIRDAVSDPASGYGAGNHDPAL